MKIVLAEPLGIRQELLESYLEEIRAMGHEVEAFGDRPQNAEALCSRVREADAVIITNLPFPGEVLRQCERLRYVDVAFTGVDHLDVACCREKGISVSNASGYSDVAVAELALSMMLARSRNIVPCNEAVRQGGTKDGLVGTELFNKTLGVVGTGKIGAAVIRLGLAFGMKVLAHSRTKKPELEALGVSFLPLEELMAQSDIVSLHVPLNDATRGLISQEMLGLMRPTAMLINTARGPVVDNAALAEALQAGRIAGAGIDVFETEPPIPDSHPLLNAPNTLLTPHVAFATREALERRAEIVFDNLKAWLGGTVQNQIC